MEECRGGQDTNWQLVRVGTSDAGANRRVAHLDGSKGPYVERALRGNFSLLKSMADDRLPRWLNSMFPAVKRQARGSRTVEFIAAMIYFVAGKLSISCYFFSGNREKPSILLWS